MIKAAHVGVGIAGIEGTAAVNSADYAVGTFRMLHTLLFGRCIDVRLFVIFVSPFLAGLF
jgi:magnesium-transporting ATPase (P-type)